MMYRMKSLPTAFILLFIFSCANNPFVEYYKPGRTNFEPTDFNESSICYVNDLRSSMKKLLEDNYLYIGESNFVGRWKWGYEMWLAYQASNIGADTALVQKDFESTQYNSLFDKGTGGGNTSTTYSCHVAYLKKNPKPPRIGLYVIDLDDALRIKYQRNKGVVVTIVVKKSRAFNADILPGDVLTKINNIDVIDKDDFVKMSLDKYPMKLDILRGDKQIQISIDD